MKLLISIALLLALFEFLGGSPSIEKQSTYEDSKDDCLKYDGKLHIHRPVCCNKKCQGCGGVQRKCAQLTDKEGKILGANECCGRRIEDSGITCGMNGRKAPCVLPEIPKFEDKREVLSAGKACDSLDNVPCSTCAKYRDGKNRKKPLDDEDSKCVWLPSIKGCKTKAFAEKKRKDYIEMCPVNCSWSEWEEETCDCDSETKTKTRVQYKEMFGGKPCEGESELVEPCDEDELETLCTEEESCPETCMCQTPPRDWPGRRNVQESGVAKGYCFHYCDPEGYCGDGQEAKAQGQNCKPCRMKFYGY